MLHYTEAIGLDIGSHAAKAVHLRRRWGRLSVKNSAWVRLPESPSERQRILESFVTKNGWRGLPCVVAPPADGVMLQSITVDPQDPRSIGSIVDLEMSQLSRHSEDITVRDYIVSRDIRARYVLLAVGRVENVQASVDLAAGSGLHPVQVSPQASALYNVVVRQWRGSRKASFIIVDIGHQRTTVVVASRSRIFDARHIPLGAAPFCHGIGERDADNRVATAAALDRWIDALAACLSVCTGTTPDTAESTSPPDVVVLTGGGASVEGLRERLAARLDLPISLLGKLTSKPHIQDVERMALASGLAMAGMGVGRVRLTLLPAATREAILLHSQVGYWVASGVALIVAILALLMGSAHELHRKQADLAHKRERLSALVQTEDELKSLVSRNKQLEEQIRPFAAVVHNGTILRMAIGAVTRALHADDWLTRIANSSSYFNDTSAPEGIAPFGQIIIEGYTPATDLATIRTMIDSLRHSPGILDADLLGDDVLERVEDARSPAKRDDVETFTIGLSLPTP